MQAVKLLFIFLLCLVMSGCSPGITPPGEETDVKDPNDPLSKASDIAPSLDNLVVVPNPEADVRILYVEIEEGVLEKVWAVAIPWSKDGLGGGDKYLGEVALMMPIDAEDPWGIAIGPGPTLAVGDRGIARLYDIEGNFLGLRPGNPEGYLHDGTLVNSVGVALHAYDKAGNLLWQVDREEIWREVMQRHAPDKEASYSGGTVDFFVSLEDLIYVRIHYYRLGQSAAHEKETVEIKENLDATLVYQPNGELLYSIPSPSHPMRFLPTGEFFGTHVPQEDGSYAHRIFAREEDRYVLKRTLYLPNASIYKVYRLQVRTTVLCQEVIYREIFKKGHTFPTTDTTK